ncbi:hypothetical protein ACIQAL_13135 [Pseudomonas sp. NPDC088368]|uniref:hypothetical protein n=1 Tax=Pseudomonas sp. NPDC088368 TaxID=3364453 RepID=UPI00380B95D9
MNQTISQMRAVHEALRQRTQQATAEFNAKPRFVVIPHRNNLFGVVDRKTGAERIEVAGHMNACRSAQQFENTASFVQHAQLGVGSFARWMLCWTAAFAVILGAFAFMGVSW